MFESREDAVCRTSYKFIRELVKGRKRLFTLYQENRDSRNRRSNEKDAFECTQDLQLMRCSDLDLRATETGMCRWLQWSFGELGDEMTEDAQTNCECLHMSGGLCMCPE